ncbi:DUF3144 domain-containing protein [Arcobacter sp. LA11]|uniref:DUF3144 domain-containing protein n=1 Tax=Arcobacter sp. LA11 TaxID=1898176 RepID=UPI0009321281|nr:DUF3144 domain-containing protein [Arcobacter sp. LA11]
MKDKEAFVKRADAHIFLANDQMSEEVSPGEVSSSFMYGLTRFNAWIAARSFETKEDMIEGKEEAIEYFLKEYKQMLEQHLDEHIEKFDFNS